MISTFILVMTIWATDGSQQDIALSFGLTYADCAEMAYYIERGLNQSADIYCELEGVY